MFLNIFTKTLLFVTPTAFKYGPQLIKTTTDYYIDKKIVEKLTIYEITISEVIKKSYKNRLKDFGLILLMLLFSFKAKKESYDVLLLFLISCVYLYSLAIVARRYYSIIKLYTKYRPEIKKYYPFWKKTRGKKIRERKMEFIELVYKDYYKNNVNSAVSIFHDIAAWTGLIKSKNEFLNNILDRVNYIYRTSLRKKLILYALTVILIFICSYAIKHLLIDVHTNFSFLDYIVYPFKQLFLIWFE